MNTRLYDTLCSRQNTEPLGPLALTAHTRFSGAHRAIGYRVPHRAADVFCTAVCSVVCTALLFFSGESRAANVFTLAECLRAIDRQILHMEYVDTDTAQQALATLAQSCEDVPQVHHNLGVIAARRGQWETAVVSFEQAIALAPQTADTVRQLTALHEYQAKMAWRVALEFDQPLTPPEFTWQSSTDRNLRIDSSAPNATGLRSVATLDFELYNWWQAWNENDSAEWSEFYVKGYTAPVFDEARPVPWESVARDIRFTTSDAAVVLQWTTEQRKQQRWLLLTLVGQRWQIYHEADL